MSAPQLPTAAELSDISFYQVVRRILAAHPGASQPGELGPTANEAIRFRPSLSLAFPPGDLASLEVLDTPDDPIAQKARLTVHFLGLYGPASPLPNHFTEELLWASEDSTERDFLDVFHHRLISFVWRTWARVRHHVRYETDGRDAMTGWYLALAGLGTRGMPEATELSAVELLRTAGVLGSGVRSAAGLRSFLRDQLSDLPIAIEPNLVRTAAIGPDQCCALGQRGSRLGVDFVLGETIRDATSSFGIVVGPLNAEEFQRFLPGGDRARRLERLTEFFIADPLQFDVELILEQKAMTPARLDGGSRLGWKSWILPTQGSDGRVRLSPLARTA